MSRRTVVAGLLVILAAWGWYAFRPDRLFLDRRVNENMPTQSGGAPVILTTGLFHSNAHETAGTATIYRLSDGTRMLRLTGFETSDGPDVQVYLVAAEDVNDDSTVKQAGFVNLGSLKGNIGDQNYPIPGDLNLASYRAVTIWCRRFSVNFGTAPLLPARAET
jgi:hypothetical protein